MAHSLEDFRSHDEGRRSDDRSTSSGDACDHGRPSDLSRAQVEKLRTLFDEIAAEWKAVQATVGDLRSDLDPEDFEAALEALGIVRPDAEQGEPGEEEGARGVEGPADSGPALEKQATPEKPATLEEVIALLKQSLASKKESMPGEISVSEEVRMEIAREVAKSVNKSVADDIRKLVKEQDGQVAREAAAAAKIPIDDVAAMIDHLTAEDARRA